MLIEVLVDGDSVGRVPGGDAETVEASARALPMFQAAMKGKSLSKKVYVEGALLSFITDERDFLRQQLGIARKEVARLRAAMAKAERAIGEVLAEGWDAGPPGEEFPTETEEPSPQVIPLPACSAPKCVYCGKLFTTLLELKEHQEECEPLARR